jgi:hypothetical protein
MGTDQNPENNDRTTDPVIEVAYVSWIATTRTDVADVTGTKQ